MFFKKNGILLRWRLILEEYGPDMEYIQGNKNIVADSSTRFTIIGNKGDSTYKKEIVSEINDI